MSLSRIIPFKISSIDSLGQGVSKEADKIAFIPKTAPGDAGFAEVTGEKKGVCFAKVQNITQPSALRRSPLCPHFESCPSCHYLHVDYEAELSFKKESLQKLFQKLSIPSLEVIPATRRLEYRNRIQLHYDLNQEAMGMFDVRNQAIIPIPECKIALLPIRNELKRLYNQKLWLKEAPKNQKKGHVELYWIDEQLKINWNRPYAEGGFTQVFSEMNERLKLELQKWNEPIDTSDLLDLFGGNGNLSQNLKFTNRLCVDIYQQNISSEFYSQDLYEANALDKVAKVIEKRSLKPKTMLLDPPRSGLKDLKRWVEKFAPEHIAYVSCDPHTLARDVATLTNYTVKRILLIDFFPSTFHFETIAFLERND